MRHGRHFRKLGRTSSHRRALLRNLTTQLLKYERIQTTLAKAKELRAPAEKMITLAKKNTEASRRQAEGWLMEPAVMHKLFGEVAQRYASRPGGYTRVLKVGNRKNDSAAMAVIELVDNPFPALRVKDGAKTGLSSEQIDLAYAAASLAENMGSSAEARAR